MEELILQNLVDEGLSQREIGDRLGKSQASVRHWLKKHGLKTKTILRTSFLCVFCGESEKELMALRHERPCHTICKSCDNKRAVDRSRENKLKAIDYKGGCCKQCGYNKNPAALSFHHVDPADKDPNFAKMKFWSFDKIKEELDKCVLVCMNCHAEIHNPITSGCSSMVEPLPSKQKTRVRFSSPAL